MYVELKHRIQLNSSKGCQKYSIVLLSMSLVSHCKSRLSLFVPFIAAHSEDETIATSQHQDNQDQCQCGHKERDGHMVECVALDLFRRHAIVGQVGSKPSSQIIKRSYIL